MSVIALLMYLPTKPDIFFTKSGNNTIANLYVQKYRNVHFLNVQFACFNSNCNDLVEAIFYTFGNEQFTATALHLCFESYQTYSLITKPLEYSCRSKISHRGC